MMDIATPSTDYSVYCDRMSNFIINFLSVKKMHTICPLSVRRLNNKIMNKQYIVKYRILSVYCHSGKCTFSTNSTLSNGLQIARKCV